MKYRCYYCYAQSLGTPLVALVAVGPVAAIDSVLVVAHDLHGLVKGALVADVVVSLATDAVPVLDATVRVGIPSIRLVGTV